MSGILLARLDDDLRGEILDLGRAYWQRKCRNGRLPARADIDPAEITDLLPFTILLDVHRDPWDFRFRLIGTGIAYHLTSDWTGKWMSDIAFMQAPSQIWDNCIAAAQGNEPYMSQTPYVGPHKDFYRADDIILPLARNGETVDMLLVFVEYLLKPVSGLEV